MTEPRTPKRRFWLGVTKGQSESASAARQRAEFIPPMPIPTRHTRSNSPTPSAPEQKRRSMPANHGRSRRRNHPQPESPDAIYGLIDSFSTISRTPRESLDAPPAANGAIPSPVIPRVRPVRSFGGGADHVGIGDYYSRSLREEFAIIDDAAEPPVVRTSKRRSGFSDFAGPKSTTRDANPLTAYLRPGSRPQSAMSLASNEYDDETRSIGNISIENGRRRSVQGGERESLESWVSAKRGHHSLITMSSRERLNSKEVDRRKDAIGSGSPLRTSAFGPDYFPTSGPASPRHYYGFDAPIKEEESEPPPGAEESISNSVTSSAKKEGKKPILADDVTTGGPPVPSRRSSLKLPADIPTQSRKSTHSRHSSGQHSGAGENIVLKEEEEMQPKPRLAAVAVEPKANLADVLDDVDTEVTKRIKELKAQKELRDKLASQSPPTDLESRMSPNTKAEATSSGLKSRRKFEGAIDVSPTTDQLPAAAKTVHSEMQSKYLNPQRNPTDERPVTPLTPTSLPINYSYVVQSLNRNSSASSKVSDSTRPPSSSRDKSKSKSLVVGDRTSSARARVTRSLNIDTSRRQQAESITSEPVNGGVTAGVTANIRPKEQQPQPPTKPRKSGSLKKKRISHPDLPANADRVYRTRNSDSLAVRPPNQPSAMKEERPATSDSIDHQVNTFIHSSRLSQKIRHPQTGRVIAFSEVGDPRGHAVFCCVGMGLTRYVTAFYDELAVALRLRLITPDRPGVGESQVDPLGTPLSWPDDVLVICNALHISKFSLIAHSAGAIYALATALRMPQNIRGRVHLLAPWIPPSQMAPIGLPKQLDAPPTATLPRAQRFLRALPAPILKVANTGLLGAASASLSPNGSQKPKSKRRSLGRSSNEASSPAGGAAATSQAPHAARRDSILLMDRQNMPNGEALAVMRSNADLRGKANTSSTRANGASAANKQASAFEQKKRDATLKQIEEDERRAEYDERLTIAIWNAATSNANPAVDLIVCLERNRAIGFRYVDITRAVVIHHGGKDTRVPVENVKWLGRTMRRCEVRVLDGEGHGLMANAGVMGGVLAEMSSEWEDWELAVQSERLETQR